MFGKKAREIQRLRKILKTVIIFENPEGQTLMSLDFEYFYTNARFFSPESRPSNYPFLFPDFFKMVRIKIKLHED